VLPGDGWVVERMHEDGSKSVFPLVGWAVTDEGDILALPLSLGPEWSARPATDGDGPLIRRSGARLAQRPQIGPYGPSLTPWIDDAT
jgi:hypothetical protein